MQVKVSKDDTIVLDGQGARDAIEERCNLLRESIDHTKSDYEKEKLQERLAKLHSGVAVIKVSKPEIVVMREAASLSRFCLFLCQVYFCSVGDVNGLTRGAKLRVESALLCMLRQVTGTYGTAGHSFR